MLYFDEIELDVGLFALLRGRLDVEVLAETASGSLEATLEADSLQLKKAKEFEVLAKTEGIQLGGIPGVRQAVGLPVSGGFNADFRIMFAGNEVRQGGGPPQIYVQQLLQLVTEKPRSNPGFRSRSATTRATNDD